jgi:adenylate cyclase
MSKRQGGAEVEISMVFADVRDSTALAEGMSPSDFRELINRFYTETSAIFIRAEAIIDRLVGDQAIGYFVPGLAGPDHAQKAVGAGAEILRATGHAESSGPWIPVGAGVHTGVAFVGTVGSVEGVTDFTALGDAVNTGARLASVAGKGELLVSDAAYTAAKIEVEGVEQRDLKLKGREERIKTVVIQA